MRPPSKRSLFRITTGAAALCALTACGSVGLGGGSGGTGELDASFDYNTGTYPFDTRERCTDTDDTGRARGLGCNPGLVAAPAGADTDYVTEAVVLGAGSTLEREDGLTVTYRGAMLQRGQTSDSANPESLRILAAFDVRNDSPSPIWADSFYDYEFGASVTKSPFVKMYQTTMNECPLRRVPTVQLKEGEEGTFEFCWSNSAPSVFLAGEPLLNAAAAIDTEDYYADFSAFFKVVGQEYDEDVREDIQATADQLTAVDEYADPHATVATADERFIEWETQGWGDLTGSAES